MNENYLITVSRVHSNLLHIRTILPQFPFLHFPASWLDGLVVFRVFSFQRGFGILSCGVVIRLDIFMSMLVLGDGAME